MTTRVRIVLEAPSDADLAAALAVCGDRLVTVGRLPTWSPNSPAVHAIRDDERVDTTNVTEPTT